jgi:hypothetical protein
VKKIIMAGWELGRRGFFIYLYPKNTRSHIEKIFGCAGAFSYINAILKHISNGCNTSGVV